MSHQHVQYVECIPYGLHFDLNQLGRYRIKWIWSCADPLYYISIRFKTFRNVLAESKYHLMPRLLTCSRSAVCTVHGPNIFDH